MWYIYAFITALTISIKDIFYKYLFNNKCDALYLLLYLFIFLGIEAIIIIFYLKIFKKNDEILTVPFKKNYKYLFPFSIFLFINGYLFLRAIKLSPNPGYAKAIINLNTLFITLFAVYFLKSHINYLTIGGIVLVIIGTFLIIKYSGT